MKPIRAALAGILMLAAPASAQWLKHADPAVPRTRDGQADLSGRAPKGRDGKPELSGVWLPSPDPTGTPRGVEYEIRPRYFVNITEDMKPEIVQMPRLILILYEDNTTFRQIFLDGRRLAPEPEPRFMGYSTGRWDRDTLIVDTVGLNDRNWLDRMGHPHSDAVHVIERFRRRDAGHLEIEVTIDDPKTYTTPITYTQKQRLLPDEDLLEYFCSENEKDVERFR
jgi:hypothetical protein